MSAGRHIQDAERESLRLAQDVDTLIAAVHAGQAINASDLEHLRRAAVVIAYHAARAGFDLARMPQEERRDMPRCDTAQKLYAINGGF